MRRDKAVSFIILIAIIMSVSTGCKTIKNAVISKKPDLDRAFSCEFSISAFDDLEVCGKMTRCGTNIWEMDIDSPETMSGLHISCNDESTDVSLDGLTMEMPAEKTNGNAVFRLIFSAVDDFAAAPSPEFSETDNGYEYSGNIPQGGYIMTFDKDTSELTGISFPEHNMTASIKMSEGKEHDSSASETVIPDGEAVR